MHTMTARLILLVLICGLAMKPVFATDYSDSTVTKVVMLGSGNPFPDPSRLGPSVAIVVRGMPYIFDAGAGVWHSIGAATPRFGGSIEGLQSKNLTRVFLTHLHSDHVVGLPSLMLMPWALGRTAPLHVYGPPGTEGMVDHLLAAFRDDIAVRRYGPGQANDTGWRSRGHDISEPGLVFQDDNVKVEAFATLHTTWPRTYAYRVTTPDKIIAISGDTVPNEGIIEAGRNVDILIHEVVTLDDQGNAPWGKGKKTKRQDFGNSIIRYYHTNTKELADIANETKPGKLVLYHVQNYSIPFRRNALEEEIKKYGFHGTIITAEDQDIF